jgi:hypothetical protein
MTGEHWLQAGRAHFNRLLHHVVEPATFERGKQILQIARGGLGPRLLGDAQR